VPEQYATYDLSPVHDGEEYRLVIHLRDGLAPGKIESSVEIFTDHPDEKHLVIPLYAIIKAEPRAALPRRGATAERPVPRGRGSHARPVHGPGWGRRLMPSRASAAPHRVPRSRNRLRPHPGPCAALAMQSCPRLTSPVSSAFGTRVACRSPDVVVG